MLLTEVAGILRQGQGCSYSILQTHSSDCQWFHFMNCFIAAGADLEGPPFWNGDLIKSVGVCYSNWWVPLPPVFPPDVSDYSRYIKMVFRSAWLWDLKLSHFLNGSVTNQQVFLALVSISLEEWEKLEVSLHSSQTEQDALCYFVDKRSRMGSFHPG